MLSSSGSGIPVYRRLQKKNEAFEHPRRKQIRLPEYDYGTPGAYFVTICTQDRRCILSSIRRGDPCGRPELRLTAYGTIAERAFRSVEALYSVTFDSFVVMPNHVHFICRIKGGRATARVAPTTLFQLKLYIWIQMLKLNTGIEGRELPRDSFLRRITVEMPGRKKTIQCINTWDALSQKRLNCKRRQFNLSNI